MNQIEIETSKITPKGPKGEKRPQKEPVKQQKVRAVHPKPKLKILLVESELCYTYQDQTHMKLVFFHSKCTKRIAARFPPEYPGIGYLHPKFLTLCVDPSSF